MAASFLRSFLNPWSSFYNSLTKYFNGFPFVSESPKKDITQIRAPIAKKIETGIAVLFLIYPTTIGVKLEAAVPKAEDTPKPIPRT